MLIGTNIPEFERPWPGGWLASTSRPYVAAFAYLLGDFTDFHLLGKFSRLALSRRVFGEEAVDVAVGRVRQVLAGWGYHGGRDNDQRLFTVVCQALLLARSPRLEDLTTKTFHQLREHSGLAAWHVSTLHGAQRAVALM